MSSTKAEAKKNNDEKHEVTLDEALKLAQGHHQSGNYILAERTYRDILRSVPDHFPTTQFLGVLLFQSGNFDEARRYMELAVETNPDNAHCLNNYGGVLAQMGEYENALELYEKALEIDPGYLDALNNKSNALWRLERYKEAEKTCRKALEISPHNLFALNNLGMVLARLVKFEEALEAWEQAVELKPEEAMLWLNWGNVLREMGRLKESEEKCAKAVELSPKNPEALNNLGNALRDQGKLSEAIDAYTRATNEKPDYYEAHGNLSIAYADDNRFEPAAISAKYAVAFKPDFVDGYSNLSKALLALAEYEQAHAAAQKAIHLEPAKAGPYLDLADILLRLDRLDDSEAAMQEAISREPDSARFYMKLSEIYDRKNDMEKALEAVDKALDMSPDMALLWLRKGLVHYINSDLEKGIEYIDKALQLSPGWPIALQHKAEMLISLNRNDEAEKIVRKILEKNKDIPSTFSTLISLKKVESEDDPDFQDMLKLEETAHKYGKEIECVFHYAVSNAYEQMKKFDKAFEHMKKANELKAATLPKARHKEVDMHLAIKQKYTPEFIKSLQGHGYESDVPIFIVGMPRSGTTLTEQIISSHPDVYGAGELADIGKVQKMSRSHENMDIAALGEEYIRRMRAYDRTGVAKKITDKMPANYMYLGFIVSILPNAKIIHCRRNPIDTCLSCYKQNFARGQYWSYDLEEMGDQYLKYLDLMEYWREVLPGRFLEINYEDTVGNFEEQARKLIDYVGLEWDDACLEPHKQKRTVLTASKAQVTKPVYKTSVDKWKRYEKGLQPLVERLLPEQALKNQK